MYVEGSAVKVALHLKQVSPHIMTGKICSDAVLYYLRQASGGRFHNADTFVSADEALRVLFSAAGNPVQQPMIRADSVVGILRKVFSEPAVCAQPRDDLGERRRRLHWQQQPRDRWSGELGSGGHLPLSDVAAAAESGLQM